MKDKILLGIAASINTYLRLDPDSQNRLAALNGKIIAIEFLPLHFRFQLICDSAHISLIQDETLKTDATVSGTPLQLLSVAIAKSNRQRFFAEDVKIEGDAAVAQQIIALFDEVNIDWEDKLATLIGGVSAHHLGSIFQQFKQRWQTSQEALTQTINEYLHEEIAIFPPKFALEDFYQDIDTLQMDVDRLEARIHAFKNKLGHKG